MIEVEQTTFAPPHGDCLAACIASILELPLADVPNLGCSTEWWQDTRDWLKPRNLDWLNWEHGPGAVVPRGYSILGADSPRGPWLHAVVCFDGAIVWDPSPDREQGVGTWRDWTVFVVLDPARPVAIGAAD